MCTVMLLSVYLISSYLYSMYICNISQYIIIICIHTYTGLLIIMTRMYLMYCIVICVHITDTKQTFNGNSSKIRITFSTAIYGKTSVASFIMWLCVNKSEFTEFSSSGNNVKWHITIRIFLPLI